MPVQLICIFYRYPSDQKEAAEKKKSNKKNREKGSLLN